MNARANDCVEQLHKHVGICQRAGYANGRADLVDELLVVLGHANDPEAVELEDAILAVLGVDPDVDDEDGSA